MSTIFISKIHPPHQLEQNTPVLWFIFHDDNFLLLKKNGTSNLLPHQSDIESLIREGIEISHQHYLGIYQNQHCYCGQITTELSASDTFQDKFFLTPLKFAGPNIIHDDLFHIGARAVQIIHWDKTHLFCAKCAAPLTASETERAKVCNTCEAIFYPRISPCVIVLITRGKEILLARSPHFKQNMYGLIAGFVEPGESLEQAVEREVMEEVSLRIKNIRYRFSQPWPFPNSLMVGFTAYHAAGEITLDGIEIEDAGWFTKDNLPNLPTSTSISRKLIDLFLTQHTDRN